MLIHEHVARHLKMEERTFSGWSPGRHYKKRDDTNVQMVATSREAREARAVKREATQYPICTERKHRTSNRVDLREKRIMSMTYSSREGRTGVGCRMAVVRKDLGARASLLYTSAGRSFGTASRPNALLGLEGRSFPTGPCAGPVSMRLAQHSSQVHAVNVLRRTTS